MINILSIFNINIRAVSAVGLHKSTKCKDIALGEKCQSECESKMNICVNSCSDEACVSNCTRTLSQCQNGQYFC